ncbi:MAG TPA: Rnf-Nqr domain containing protein [Candidatus Mcinerneyibacteriales bacterium]|jgi:Na+-transporting NADH:ubiquinone oxidoreductase subunit E|nr:NADH:ubiquinone reductase (Na(+)-transporting) subunit E [Candidatus Mcinerneyibacteriota bacterium]HOO59109.1 Rnf-Nqr domain containing protein [Candidatus Mcinerneyibacteriales bacterium]HPE20767.1 Rnf-Nqr domain containing protein [Candidatus Mcinerneyibacteriales bacterium]HPJ69680.1 Rnf-Nqr domain containing protein [Candidatus Mcinerneyibacteriales bacterium]HPQ88798.1 Rnf-Nqr domain containing protein [Candidatus Mcinerneyibacteriales bacterium]
MTFLGAFAVFFAAIFTNNILLTNYLGMCSFLSVSREVKTSVGLGAAVTFVMAFTSAINWAVYHYLLVPDLVYLRYIVFIVVIAAFVQIVEMIIERVSDVLYAALGIFLPLITVNCAILGVSLFMVIREYTFLQSFAFGLGSGLGWMLAIIAMAGIRRKIAKSPIPRGLEGAGITLIIAGIMAMAFVGFSGMITLG